MSATSSQVPEHEIKATLWEENPEATALLRVAFALAGVGLQVVASESELLRATSAARPGDFVLIDCSEALPGDMARCTAIARQTNLPLHIIHPRDQVVAAVGQATRSEVLWLDPDTAGLLLVEKLRVLKGAAPVVAKRQAYEHLLPLERETLRLVGEGYTNKQIARALNRGESTVKGYVARVMDKTGRSSRAELMAYHHLMGQVEAR